ncbi:MAG: choice-of-anchor J domain-containing protein, partial [Candidatus Zophobacter franzmannii]|nr:choice-of-anchor J domain-containing protein [Candidatus Zophobacter franzmannii]
IIDNVTEDRESHDIPLHGYGYLADGNETSMNATEVVLDVVNLPTIIEPAIDIDWYAFWQAGPAQLEIHTENLYGSTIDLAAFLYGPYNDLGQTVDEGTAIYNDDDSFDGTNPEIIATITESGFYFLRVASFDNAPNMGRAVKKEGRNTRWDTGDYAIWIETDNHLPPSGFDPPSNLAAAISYQGIGLTWDVPVPEARPLVSYNIYRDDVVINAEEVTTTFYLDVDPILGTTYEYKVTALYTGPTGESPACDSIMVDFIAVDPPVIADDFEAYDDFTANMGDWILLDQDGENTHGFNNGIDFTGENAPMSFIVFNPAGTVPPLQFADAYSGDKYAASFAADSGSNDDWMISPQIQLTANEANIQLIARSYTIQYGMEKFEVAVSMGTADPADFTVISGDVPVEVPLAWTQFEYDLAPYANEIIRVAIHCVSQQTFFLMLDDVMITNDGATVENDTTPVVPEITRLRSNYPNPFNPETTISFDLKDNSDVIIDVYNVKGQRIATVVDRAFSAGSHSVVWNGEDYNGSTASSGVYFYKMQSGTYTKTKKMILMK